MLGRPRCVGQILCGCLAVSQDSEGLSLRQKVCWCLKDGVFCQAQAEFCLSAAVF